MHEFDIWMKENKTVWAKGQAKRGWNAALKIVLDSFPDDSEGPLTQEQKDYIVNLFIDLEY